MPPPQDPAAMEVESSPIFQDIFGDGKGLGNQDGPAIQQPSNGQAGYMNAYDTAWTLEKWRTEPLSMMVPFPDEPNTCEDICIKRHKDADEKCSIARKRVELGLTKAGCPCKVLAVRRPNPCGESTKTVTPTQKSQFL
jgi:hypothetical protein